MEETPELEPEMQRQSVIIIDEFSEDEEYGADELVEPTSDEPKYEPMVTTSLLSEIKMEEIKYEEKPLTGDFPENLTNGAVINLVPKMEMDIEFLNEIRTNEPPDLKSEIEPLEELVPFSFIEDIENNSEKCSFQGFKLQQNPVVLIERLDLKLMHNDVKAPGSVLSMDHSAPYLRLKIEGSSAFNHVSHHDDENLENQKMSRLATNLQNSLHSKRQNLAEANHEKHKLEKFTGPQIMNFFNGDRSFLCDRCAKPFTSYTAFLVHYFLCDQYLRQLELEPLINGYLGAISNVQPYKISNSHSTGHFLSHQRDDPVPSSCETPLSFEKKNDLKRHNLKAQNDDRSFSCDECFSKFKSKDKLQRHVMHVHIGDRPFECDQCSYKFKAKDKLQRHKMKVHCIDRSFSCGHCLDKFNLKDELEVHILRVHANLSECDQSPLKCTSKTESHTTDGLFTCNQCLSNLKSKRAFMSHIKRAHVAVRPSSCDESSIKKSKATVKGDDKYVPVDNPPFSCNQCPCKFKSRATLHRHVKYVHVDNRPLYCGQCSRILKSKSALRRHMKYVHVTAPSFPCDQCSSEFQSRVALHRHVLNVHVGDRPFSCDQCSCKFKLQATLQTHVRYVHVAKRRFSCGQCSSKFTSRSDLTKHIQCVHVSDRTSSRDRPSMLK